MPASFKYSLLALGGLGIALALAGCGGSADVTGPSTTATGRAFGERSFGDTAGGRYPAGLALYMADKLADSGDYRSAVTIYQMAHRQNFSTPSDGPHTRPQRRLTKVFGQERALWRCGASQSVRDAVRKPWYAAVAVAYAARRRASKSFDDAPHRLRLSSYPTSRLRDLYES